MAIDSIVLQHFQSHKKTLIELDKGVNVFVGDSNSGKTSIIRALNWVVNNRPSGIAFVSDWDRDDNGDPIKPSFVTINKNNLSIKRIRTKELNGYRIKNNDEEKTLEAIKLSVPDEVTELLKLSEVNIQNQTDQPFLLSQSASDVARFLNKEIELDKIDKILGLAETKRKRLNQSIKGYNSDILSKEKELEKFDNLEKAELLNKQLNELEVSIDESENIIEELTKLKIDYKKYVKIIDEYSKIPFKKVASFFEELETIDLEIKELKTNIAYLSELKLSYNKEVKNIDRYKTIYNDLIKKLPKVCPICGNELNKDKCK
jgi:DNA repair exonuclease SbcCD ATPase subunit